MGSPFWQAALFLAALAFLVWETWRGWRAGVIRSGLALAAIVLSALIGMAAAHLAAMPFGGFREVPGLIAGLFVGGGVAVVIFFAVWLLSVILFKRTEHQSSGLFRVLWGVGGAFFGFLVGLVIVWSGISVVRALGALAEARVETAEKQARAANQPAQPPKVASSLLTLKDSLELGPAGKFVQTVDPMPPDVYELIAQVGKLSSDQELMLRFLQYPGIQEVMQSPKIAELVNDPSVIRAAENRDILSLMSNKALLAAVEDPALAEKLKKIDLRAALKHALDPASSPPPSPSPSPAK